MESPAGAPPACADEAETEDAAPSAEDAARLQRTLRGSAGRPLQALPARARAWLAPRLDTAEGTQEARARARAPARGARTRGRRPAARPRARRVALASANLDP